MRRGISASVICLNAEQCIRPCLESVRWADETIVVDCGSTDGTLEVAREFTDRVYQEPLTSVAAMRARGMELAENDWVISLDADERVPLALAQEIQDWLSPGKVGLHNGFWMPRTTLYLGRWIRHGAWYPDRQLRLSRKSQTEISENPPHDVINVNGSVGRLRDDLEHCPPDSLSSQLGKMESYAGIFAQDQAEAGRRTNGALILGHCVYRFIRNYILRLGFLDGIPGLIIALQGAFYAFEKYALLWEARARQCHAGSAVPEPQQEAP